MAEINHPHDTFFKQFLAKPEIAADFLRHHLPADVVALLELPALNCKKTVLLMLNYKSIFLICFIECQRKQVPARTSICSLSTKVTLINGSYSNYCGI